MNSVIIKKKINITIDELEQLRDHYINEAESAINSSDEMFFDRLAIVTEGMIAALEFVIGKVSQLDDKLIHNIEIGGY